METTTLTTTTTHQPDDKAIGQKASYGLIGVAIFVLILMIVLYARRRCSHDDDEGSVCDEEIADGTLMGSTSSQHSPPVQPPPRYLPRLNRTLNKILQGNLLDNRHIRFGDVIGKGQFGCVYEASYHDRGDLTTTPRRVAVKTLKGGCDVEAERLEDFLREGMVMREFNHDNVLTLIGVTFGEGSLPMIVLPFMAHGNLKVYVSRPELAITVRQLLEFALQVARGMSYLALKKFVHRDLAARNCMLNDEMVVKVADFGLSRDIYTKDYYSSKDGQALLPVKWMAIESLLNSIYTTKTDVWSYGVLLWELMTRGATPYPDVSNWDIKSYIVEGRRMHKPISCPDEVYELMIQCWSATPIQRPYFQEIMQRLTRFLHSDEDENSDKEDERPASPHLYINLATTVNAYSRPPSEVI